MKKLFLFVFILTNSLVFAQVKFTASTDRTSYGINENIQLAFEMNVDADDFTLPKIEGFRVEGPFLTMQNYNINGRRGFQKTYRYFLTPTKQGEFIIKEAQMEYGGKVYKSNSLKIKIGKAVPVQRQQQQQNNQYYDPFDDPFFNQGQPQRQQTPANLGEGVFIVAEVSNKNPYVNEPVKVVYKIYFDVRIQIGNVTDVKKPKYNGFWSQFYDFNRPAVQATYKGKVYGMSVLGTSILYPLEAGNKPIEAFSFNAEIDQPNGQRYITGEPVMEKVRKQLSSGSQMINVKALPTAGKPENFTGAVGNFQFKVTPSKTTLKGGESLDLNVSVTGNGNLKLFSLPKPEVPVALEMYDPEHIENVQTPLTGMTGSIADKYTIVPQYKGKYPIKPMSFSYFDLSSKSYKTITSEQIMVDVLDGPDFATAQKDTLKNSKNKDAVNKPFADIKQKTEFLATKNDDFFGTKLFYGLLLFPFILIPIIVIAKRRKDAKDADVTGNRIRNSNRLVKKYLSEAKKQIKNKEPFYIALERAMHNFLKAKLHIETTEMSKEKITELLLSRNANPETVTEFINLTENCEIARYAPATSFTIQHDFDKAVAIISDLEKQIK